MIITAPSTEKLTHPSVFLAGGITNCHDWQSDVIDILGDNPSFCLVNPRQKHFDVTNKNAAFDQIKWEYDRLEQMDIFSMYFCNGESDQPICMYELGRNILRMQNRFPSDWHKRIVISIEAGYKREQDVLIQTGLCTGDNVVPITINATPETHAACIKHAINMICNN